MVMIVVQNNNTYFILCETDLLQNQKISRVAGILIRM